MAEEPKTTRRPSMSDVARLAGNFAGVSTADDNHVASLFKHSRHSTKLRLEYPKTCGVS